MLSDSLVNSVLRAYQNQLGKKRKFVTSKDRDISSPGKNNFSEAKRKAIIERLSQTIVNQLIDFGPQGNIERDVLKLLEDECGTRLAISKNNQEGLTFKEIDENGVTINALSIEDSKILRHRLDRIAKETVNKNMI